MTTDTSDQYTAMLHTSIRLSALVLGTAGITRGQYYWVLFIKTVTILFKVVHISRRPKTAKIIL